MSGPEVRTVRLLFADEGAYHSEDVQIEPDVLDQHDRLIDVLLEEPSVLKRLHVDFDRLCSARILEAGE